MRRYFLDGIGVVWWALGIPGTIIYYLVFGYVPGKPWRNPFWPLRREIASEKPLEAPGRPTAEVQLLSLRLQAMRKRGALLVSEPTYLGIALYMIVDKQEYGHAILISKEQIEELFKTEKLFIYKSNPPLNPLTEGQLFPKEEVPADKL